MTSCQTLPPGNKSKEIFGAGVDGQMKRRDDQSPPRGGSDSENTPTTALIDSRLPITRMHAFKLRQSWKCVRRDLEQTALDALIRMLRKNSDYSSLVGLDVDRIGSGEFERMAMKLFSAIDDCVTKAADADVPGILEYAQQISNESPFNENGLIKDYEQPVMAAIKQTLGDRYSDTMDFIYQLVIRFIVDSISKRQ